MATQPRNHRNQYTVGWICALPKEQTAATAMLDRTHLNLPNPPSDSNTYTLGSIGEHNVVIACLPMGKIGNNQAAAAVSLMVSTFTSIKFALMVGIGAGIPPEVRLGDVVVSSPVDQYSGVVQWDFGKERQNDSFLWTGSLNSPPNFLLTAVTKLITAHEINRSQHLEPKVKSSKLPLKYQRSDSLKDVLFKADYQHISKSTKNSGDGQEESCEFCDKDQVIERTPRDMSVHYGLIASGNSVMKSATSRDKLNKYFDNKVLCIEMEAAGVMTSCPCIVIRGICDYADSHKNKEWQEYAAAVAAVFAKELLKYVQQSEVEGEPPMKEKLSQEVLIPNLQSLQHALNKIEVLCARLNRQLGEKKEKIVDLKIDLKKTQKRQINTRSYARSRKWKEKYSQLMRDLRRTEKEEDALWNRLEKANAAQHNLRKQVTKARQRAREISDRLIKRSQGTVTLQGRGNRSTNSRRASSNEARIFIVRSRKDVKLAPARGVHRVWRW